MTQNEEMLKMEPRKIMKSGNLMSPALFTMVQMLLLWMQRLRALRGHTESPSFALIQNGIQEQL
jgi:hypothetical protein